MILLDTHIWVWWVHSGDELSKTAKNELERREPHGFAVSIFSCWEVAKLVEYGRLELPIPLEQWLDQALAYPEVRLLELTPRIVVESTQLPGSFHRDPADQLIVATARAHRLTVATADGKILDYNGVETLDLSR